MANTKAPTKKVSTKKASPKKTSVKKTPAKKTTVKKTPVKKAPAKKVTKKRSPSKKTKKPAVTAPVIEPVQINPNQIGHDIAPDQPLYDVPTPVQYQSTLHPEAEEKISKTKLWIGVSFITVLLFIAWAYSIRYTVLDPIETTTNSLTNNKDVSEIVDTIKTDFSDFKDNVSGLEQNVTNTKTGSQTGSNEPTNAPTTTPTTDELENLFSGIN